MTTVLEKKLVKFVDLRGSQLEKDLRQVAKDLADWLTPDNSHKITSTPLVSGNNGHIRLHRESPAQMGTAFRQNNGQQQEPRLILSVGNDPNMAPIQLAYDPATGDRAGISVSCGISSGMNHYKNHDESVSALLLTAAGLSKEVGVKGSFIASAAKGFGVQHPGGKNYDAHAGAAYAHLNTQNIQVAHGAMGEISRMLDAKAGFAHRL